MAFSGDYAEATITNPASSLTDFTVLIDLSRMPTDWWAAVDTSDGTKGRVVLDSGPTEVASDWYEFDDVAETGWVRAKWAGTLATSGTQVLRIYPPKSGNTSYAAGDTFGQHNAYDSSWTVYIPDGGVTDRTSNANNGTAQGGVTAGGATGKIGAATDFDGTNDYIDVGAVSVSAGFSGFAWAKHDTETTDQAVIGTTDPNFDPPVQLWRDEFTTDRYSIALHDGAYNVRNGTTNPGTVWRHVALTFASGTAQLFVDGAQEGSDLTGIGTLSDADPPWAIGANNISSGVDKAMDGLIQEYQIHAGVRGAEWIEHEYEQSNDQATFWGTWTWTTVGGGGIDPAVALYHHRHHNQAA